MTHADNIVQVDMRDGGDGSTYLSMLFDDGSAFNVNPDLPPDGHVEWNRDHQTGKLVKTVVEEEDWDG